MVLELLIDLNESALQTAGVSRFNSTNLYLNYQEPAEGGLISNGGVAFNNLDQYSFNYNPSSKNIEGFNG